MLHDWRLVALLCGALWGSTTPFLKKYSRSYPSLGLRSLLRNWRFVIAWLCNALGSVLFYWALALGQVSRVVIVCKGTEFVFIVLVGREHVSARQLLGAALVAAAIGIMQTSAAAVP